MSRIFINIGLDLRVNFHADNSFCILGNEELISDETLLGLSEGIKPAGWVTEQEHIATFM